MLILILTFDVGCIVLVDPSHKRLYRVSATGPREKAVEDAATLGAIFHPEAVEFWPTVD